MAKKTAQCTCPADSKLVFLGHLRDCPEVADTAELLAPREDELRRGYAQMTVDAWRHYAQHWRDRARNAEAAVARMDALHQPHRAQQHVRCPEHKPGRYWVAPVDCPMCAVRPVWNCTHITCCYWPCAIHLALYDETEDTCAHHPEEASGSGPR
ncbi:hypothetical protein [Sphaerisporangium sp. TRM90804]|uniref:hypothetical protein n=1 Tax=Sphaerisporangium sp. TRM90804 TaxID=3031113 RepID=UPI002448ECC5|nr:hypothetical protein [Sphaerisporangium sp. TRM90804]MDH2424784.1 hypothetical protein [Sphaerisporangium sp. TRM90804]